MAAATIPSYQYQRLQETDSIRLIELLPSENFNNILKCRMIHTTLREYDEETIDHYTALSYVWGDPHKDMTVTIDDQPFAITANLSTALCRIRDLTRARKVWADAICINQDDNQEKLQQVGQMADIYRQAQHTTIYLGEATASSDALFADIASSSDLTPGSSRLADSLTTTINDLVARPWFGRVWVFQELLFSRDPWLQCGESRKRWEALIRLCYIIPSKSITKGVSKLVDMDNSRQNILRTTLEDMPMVPTHYKPREKKSPYPTNLFQTLVLRRGMGVTDPRDMIYAHFGVARAMSWRKSYISCLAERLVADYTISTHDVFSELAAFLVDSGLSLELLEQCIPSSVTSPTSHDLSLLPSWCPDWTRTGPPDQTFSKEKLWQYSAGAFILVHPLHNYEIATPAALRNAMVLTCDGYEAGRIIELSREVTESMASFRVALDMLGITPETDGRRSVLMSVVGVVGHWAAIMPFPSLNLLMHSNNMLGKNNKLADLLRCHAQGEAVPGLTPHLTGQRFALLNNGALALVPGAARVSDEVCILRGKDTPYVLRDVERDLASERTEQVWRDINTCRHSQSHVTRGMIKHCKFVGVGFVDFEQGRSPGTGLNRIIHPRNLKWRLFAIH